MTKHTLISYSREKFCLIFYPCFKKIYINWPHYRKSLLTRYILFETIRTNDNAPILRIASSFEWKKNCIWLACQWKYSLVRQNNINAMCAANETFPIALYSTSCNAVHCIGKSKQDNQKLTVRNVVVIFITLFIWVDMSMRVCVWEWMCLCMSVCVCVCERACVSASMCVSAHCNWIFFYWYHQRVTTDSRVNVLMLNVKVIVVVRVSNITAIFIISDTHIDSAAEVSDTSARRVTTIELI